MIRLLAVLLLALASCASTGGGGAPAGVVSAVVLGEPGQAPQGFVKYDGNALCARGSVALTAEIYLAVSGIPLLLRVVDASETVVHVRKPEFTWKGSASDPIPHQVRHLFRAGEILAWGLTFTEPFPPIPHSTPTPAP